VSSEYSKRAVRVVGWEGREKSPQWAGVSSFPAVLLLDGMLAAQQGDHSG
jgi:hypothetical protein